MKENFGDFVGFDYRRRSTTSSVNQSATTTSSLDQSVKETAQEEAQVNEFTGTIINLKTEITLPITTLVLKVKVKVSHSLLAVGAVGVRVPLFLGHS